MRTGTKLTGNNPVIITNLNIISILNTGIKDKYEYWTVGVRPVILKYENGKKLEVVKYDWDTGTFVSGWEYYVEITMSFRGDMDELTREEFISHVETLRGKLTFTGKLEELYTAARAITATAKEVSRALTQDEKERLFALQYESYRLFEATVGGRMGWINQE